MMGDCIGCGMRVLLVECLCPECADLFSHLSRMAGGTGPVKVTQGADRAWDAEREERIRVYEERADRWVPLFDAPQTSDGSA